MKYYENFSKWLDKYLVHDLPSDSVAVNFNLYEGADNAYHVQFIASDEFDEEDQDWACSEIFSTGEDIFRIPRTRDINKWEDGLVFIRKIVAEYLDKGKYAEKLKKFKAVGIGFVDGDINILYMKK